MVMVTYTSKCDSITNHSFIPPVDAAARTIGLLPVKDVVHQFQYAEAGEPNSSLFLLTPQSASRLQSGAGNRFRLVPEVAAKQ